MFCNFSYDLPSICDCSQECVSALLGDQLSGLKDEEMTRNPSPNAVDLLNRVIGIQGIGRLSIEKRADIKLFVNQVPTGQY